MDVFKVHEQVIADYRAFTSGFVEVRDERIKALRRRSSSTRACQWPDPWLSLNPSLRVRRVGPRPGRRGPACTPSAGGSSAARTTRRTPAATRSSLHRHQREAVEVARTRQELRPDHRHRLGQVAGLHRPDRRRGAARRDAERRQRDARGQGDRRLPDERAGQLPGRGAARSSCASATPRAASRSPSPATPARRARTSGARILADPPDILLTNYVMLELVLTRPDERKHLVRAAQGLRFLVLDELHTYRGRQGADVAMLIRRLRDECAADDLQVVGTSATMASGGHRTDQSARVVAGVATRLFGTEVTPERVIGETLVRATPRRAARPPRAWPARSARDRRQRTADTFAEFAADPLASWVETTFGLDAEAGHRTRWSAARRPPCPRPPQTLAELHRPRRSRPARTALRATSCARAPRSGTRHADRPVFAFRLHQFLSKGDTVYVSLEPEDTRHITGTYQVRVPGAAREGAAAAGLLPRVRPGVPRRRQGRPSTARTPFVSRRDADASGGDSVTGYLYVSSDLPVAGRPARRPAASPDSWLVTDPRRPGRGHRQQAASTCPTPVWLRPDGTMDGTARRACRPGSSPPRSPSACAAASPTSRSAAATSASSPPSTPRAAPARSRCCQRSHRPQPASRARERSCRRRRASCSPSSTTGRTPACRPATSTTSSRSPSCAPPCTPRCVEAGPDGLTHEVARRRRHRRPRPADAPTSPQTPERQVRRQARTPNERCAPSSSTSSTSTCSAAGASPCPTSSRPACSRSPTATCPSSPRTRSPGRAPTCSTRSAPRQRAGAVPDPARRAAPRPRDRRRLPHRGRASTGSSA